MTDWEARVQAARQKKKQLHNDVWELREELDAISTEAHEDQVNHERMVAEGKPIADFNAWQNANWAWREATVLRLSLDNLSGIPPVPVLEGEEEAPE
jgi:FtsZ-binding cell division protein ZapB